MATALWQWLGFRECKAVDFSGPDPGPLHHGSLIPCPLLPAQAAPVDTRTGKLLADKFVLPTPQPATPANCAETLAQLAEHFKVSGGQLPAQLDISPIQRSQGWQGLAGERFSMLHVQICCLCGPNFSPGRVQTSFVAVPGPLLRLCMRCSGKEPWGSECLQW